jgi:peptidoglycan/LPS O-acetylase OafA/YrhL
LGSPLIDISKPRNPRYESLDIWRGFACVIVVFFHSSFYGIEGLRDNYSEPWRSILWLISRLWVGVPIFFVISGYCIAATADSSRRKKGGLGKYFYRRVRRIFPPYWIFLAITIPLMIGVDHLAPTKMFADNIHPIHGWSSVPWHVFGNITLTENWRAHLVGPVASRLFVGHAWTLCYEEQFYVVTGLLLLISRRWFFLNCLALTALILMFLIGVPQMQEECDGFFFDGQWTMFAMGILVYFCTNYSGRFGMSLASAALSVGLVVSAYFVLQKNGFAQRLFVAFGFALAATTLRPFDQVLTNSWLLWPLRFCGRMCYSMYLVHWPVVKFTSHVLYAIGLIQPWQTVLVTMPICALSAAGIAWVFHLLVERRFLNQPQTSGLVSRPPSRPMNAAFQRTILSGE